MKDLTLKQNHNLNYKYLRKLEQLTKFTCAFYDEILDEAIKFISSLVNLKYLKIDYDCWQPLIVTKLIPILVLENLEELNLKDCTFSESCITDNALIIFSEHLRNLKKFTLSRCKNVTDIGLNAITGLPKLEFLSLSSMVKITDKGFNTMKNLKKLILIYCKNIAIDGLKKILTESEKLDYLFISACFKVNYADLLLFANEITKKRENNIVLHVHENIFDHYSNTDLTNVKKSPLLEFTDQEYQNE